ncbi:MAG: AsmA protein [Gammaproteobacteria bacterium]|jgi:AsmA protein|nr:AsmA protein [Gammaproteobacteria bacterium]
MRTGKILTIVVGALIAFIAVLLLAVRLLVDPNDYKPRIAAAVKDATGRELVLNGAIKLSVFPWIALELGPASLGNPPGFSEQPFVSFQRASVRVKVLPLLSKRLEVGRVEMDGLDLRLLKNAEGQGNWEGFGRSEEPTPAAGQPKTGGALQGIEGIKISNARVTYQNITVTNLRLETGSFVDKGVVPVTLHLDAERGPAVKNGGAAIGPAGDHASLDMRFNFSADAAAEKYSMAALNLNCVVNRPGNDRPLRFSISAPVIDLNLKAQTLSAPAYEVNADGALVNGSVSATAILDAPAASGSVKLAPLVVREWLPRVGIATPKTRDEKALSLVSASGDFWYGKQAVHFEQLQATLDDTHLKGTLGLDLNTEAVKFDLVVDTFDADRYLPPPPPPGTPVPVTAPAPKPKSAEALKPLDANGTLAVGSAHFSPLDLSNVKVTVATNDKVMHIFPLRAQVYGGQYSGDVTLDSRTSMPALSLDEHLTGIDVGKLMAKDSKYLHVSGRGNVSLKATARGEGADAILKTLNGKFDLNVADGAVEGIDLGYALAQADALIGKHQLSNAPNTKRTKFDALKMSADISAGIAATHDLTIASSALKITGEGSANLPAKTVDLKLLADTLKTAGNTPLKIPVKVTGSMTDPTVRPDVEALAKGQLKEKLKDVLKDKLKALFH